MFDRKIHHRRSIRVPGYDYASAGFYFVTICVQGREALLGESVDDEIGLNDAGRMVAQVWRDLPGKFPSVELDHYIIMPNHFHGILHLTDPNRPNVDNPVGADLCVRPGTTTHAGPERPGGHAGPERPGGHAGPERPGGHAGPERPGGHAGPPLPTIIQWFKTMSTNAYIQAVKNNDWPPFHGRFWQRNYYERIIRDETELHNARQYIWDNPVKWANDSENPANRTNGAP